MLTINAYSYEELDDEGKKKARDYYGCQVAPSLETPWEDETLASADAVLKQLGLEKDEFREERGGWQLSLTWESSCFLEDVEEADGNLESFLETKLLIPLGYKKDAEGKYEFPGLCPLTGYCSDEDIIEALWGNRKEPAAELKWTVAQCVTSTLTEEREYLYTDDAFEDWVPGKLFWEDGSVIPRKLLPRKTEGAIPASESVKKASS